MESPRLTNSQFLAMVDLKKQGFDYRCVEKKRRHDNEGRKWQSADIEIQRLTIRSISAFVGCISPNMLQHPLVKDSVADMVMALTSITQTKNEAVLGMASDVTVTFVGALGNLISSHHLLKLVDSLSCLLSFSQPSIATSCANALNHILSKLVPKRRKSHNEVWEILNESKAVDCVICGLQDFITGSKPYEHFQAMVSLLKTILLLWPSSRFPVWSNAKLLEGLGALCMRPDSSVKVSVMQLYFAIALCGSGANKLLDSGKQFLSILLNCMDSSQPYSVRMEAFKLTHFLVRSEQGWLKVDETCYERIVEAIIDAMGERTTGSEKVATDQVPLLVEACRLALIARWGGEHHTYFWKLGIDRILLNLLINNFCKSKQSRSFLSLRDLIATARKGLDANYLGGLRPYIWPILGWLATYCPKDFNPHAHGNNCLNVLITCGCLILIDTIHNWRPSVLDFFHASRLEPAARAVLLMVDSPCDYIASQARDILNELSTPMVEVYVRNILGTINTSRMGKNFSVVNKDQTVVDLIVLSCLSALPRYQSFIIENDGILILSTFTKWCLSNNADVAPHSQSTSNCSTCCMLGMEDWEGGDTLSFFSLWVLVELIRGGVNSACSGIQALVDELQKISGSTSSSPGLRWCSSYILRFFGFYGFPSSFGTRLGKALGEKELADVHLKLFSGECLGVHGVILVVRCPLMLTSGESPSNGRMCGGSFVEQDIEQGHRSVRREIRLSERVDYAALLKLLEFVYIDFVQVKDDLVKQLKILARGCNLHSLSHLLGRKFPIWGTKVPSCDLLPALGQSGCYFFDFILEAKADELVVTTCTYCSLSLPHIHVHKIILWLSCDYFKALFQSGMQESLSQNIKVPVSWEALSKLVSWFYSGKLPKPSTGCLWNNMDAERQLQEVHPYVELCSLAEFWLLEDFRDETLRVVVSCLKSSKKLPLKVIQIACELSQWEIVEVACDCLAPSYPHLRDSGDLEILNENLADMVRVAYVRLTQNGACDYSD